MIAYAIDHHTAPAAPEPRGVTPFDRSFHYGPGREDYAPSRVTLDDVQEELLTQIAAGRSRGFDFRTSEVADDLAHLGLADVGARGWDLTPAGRAHVGPVAQRWPRYRMPARGRHDVERVVRRG
jgi:hypothetical protein